MDDIIVPAVLILGVYCFVWLVRSRTRGANRKNTRRTAESMYPLYADSIKKQRKYAKEHGGSWKDDGGLQDALTKRSTPPPTTAPPPGEADAPGRARSVSGGAPPPSRASEDHL